jgi:hypothetical protein
VPDGYVQPSQPESHRVRQDKADDLDVFAARQDPCADVDAGDVNLVTVLAELQSILELARDIRRELAAVMELLEQAKTVAKATRPRRAAAR